MTRAGRPLGRILLVAAGAALASCSGAPKAQPAAAAPASQSVSVRMTTSAGPIVLELDPVAAPVTVANFLSYVDKHQGGGYDGTVFHRVVAGFVIQGGGYSAQFVEQPNAGRIVNEWQNGLKNRRGTIAMARDEQPDTATREFYINLVDNPKLDTAREKTGNAGYAVFGRVVAGMDVVDRIGAVATAKRADPKITDGSFDNVPVEPILITRVERVESAGPQAVATGNPRGFGFLQP